MKNLFGRVAVLSMVAALFVMQSTSLFADVFVNNVLSPFTAIEVGPGYGYGGWGSGYYGPDYYDGRYYRERDYYGPRSYYDHHRYYPYYPYGGQSYSYPYYRRHWTPYPQNNF